MKILDNLPPFFRSKLFRYGVPFLVLVVGGSFGLKEFAQLRYQYSQKSGLSRKDLEKFGFDLKKRDEITLEAEFEKYKEMDIDNWKQVRGPRPWEEKVN